MPNLNIGSVTGFGGSYEVPQRVAILVLNYRLGFLNSADNSNPTFEYFPSKGPPINMAILDRTLVCRFLSLFLRDLTLVNNSLLTCSH